MARGHEETHRSFHQPQEPHKLFEAANTQPETGQEVASLAALQPHNRILARGQKFSSRCPLREELSPAEKPKEQVLFPSNQFTKLLEEEPDEQRARTPNAVATDLTIRDMVREHYRARPEEFPGTKEHEHDLPLHEGRLWVPFDPKTRKKVLDLYHDSPVAGRQGVTEAEELAPTDPPRAQTLTPREKFVRLEEEYHKNRALYAIMGDASIRNEVKARYLAHPEDEPDNRMGGRQPPALGTSMDSPFPKNLAEDTRSKPRLPAGWTPGDQWHKRPCR